MALGLALAFAAGIAVMWAATGEAPADPVSTVWFRKANALCLACDTRLLVKGSPPFFDCPGCGVRNDAFDSRMTFINRQFGDFPPGVRIEGAR